MMGSFFDLLLVVDLICCLVDLFLFVELSDVCGFLVEVMWVMSECRLLVGDCGVLVIILFGLSIWFGLNSCLILWNIGYSGLVWCFMN